MYSEVGRRSIPPEASARTSSCWPHTARRRSSRLVTTSAASSLTCCPRSRLPRPAWPRSAAPGGPCLRRVRCTATYVVADRDHV